MGFKTLPQKFCPIFNKPKCLDYFTIKHLNYTIFNKPIYLKKKNQLKIQINQKFNSN